MLISFTSTIKSKNSQKLIQVYGSNKYCLQIGKVDIHKICEMKPLSVKNYTTILITDHANYLKAIWTPAYIMSATKSQNSQLNYELL